MTADAGSGQNVNYAHSVGEVVTAAVKAGFRVAALHEHLRLDGRPLPLLFTLLASRPAVAT